VVARDQSEELYRMVASGACDPLIEQVRSWIARRNMADALVAEWQDLEHQFSLKVRSLGLDFEASLKGDFPESRKLRALMKRIQSEDRRLDRSAQEILAQSVTSREGAIAKVFLGARIAPAGSDENLAWALVKNGIEGLHKLQSI